MKINWESVKWNHTKIKIPEKSTWEKILKIWIIYMATISVGQRKLQLNLQDLCKGKKIIKLNYLQQQKTTKKRTNKP